MKIITLIQPWANLVVLGAKQIETRSWPTNIRGTIGIHAGKKIDKSVFLDPTYKEIFERHNITPQNIITSAIIGTCDIVDVQKTELLISTLSKSEELLGNFSPGRYGWILSNIKQINPITNIKGKLGFWNHEI